MILVIRISGLVEVPSDVQEALFRMRLRRKYAAVLVQRTPETDKLLQKVRSFVAYGDITTDGIKELIKARGISTNEKKLDADKIVEQLDKKKLEELGIKPFFRLHPPRGGIDSKIHFPKKKGVLGDHQDKIIDLLRRML